MNDTPPQFFFQMPVLCTVESNVDPDQLASQMAADLNRPTLSLSVFI